MDFLKIINCQITIEACPNEKMMAPIQKRKQTYKMTYMYVLSLRLVEVRQVENWTEIKLNPLISFRIIIAMIPLQLRNKSMVAMR